ncbi:MAG: DNA polymerase III subunit delta [Candidatus Berkelbacteria bacterium]|nr:DNA polymerase III subunit delta [Candidatus Berkelbacteria bacterium]
MFYFFYGDDTFSIKQKVQKMVDDFVAAETDINLTHLDGEKINSGSLGSVVLAMPFLGKLRMTVVNNFLKNSDKISKKSMIEILQKLPEYSTVILAEKAGVDMRESEFKLLAKMPGALNFPAPSDSILRKFAENQLSEAEIKISSSALFKLVLYVGPDFWRLENETAKLVAYVASLGKSEITDLDVEANILPVNNQKIFDLTDALAEKNSIKAVNTLQNFRKFGEDDMKIFNLIISHFRSLLIVESFGAVDSAKVAAQSGIHPFVAKKMQFALKRKGKFSLRTIYAKLAEIDWQVKRGEIDLAAALDLLVIKFCV